MTDVDALPELLQARVLRLLRSRLYDSGRRPHLPFKARLIASTSVTLDRLTSSLRPDLASALQEWVVTVPPLRERRADIIPFASRFLGEANAAAKRKLNLTLTREARGVLLDYHWPGNIYELSHCMKRACDAAVARFITPRELPDSIKRGQSSNQDWSDSNIPCVDARSLRLAETEKSVVLHALSEFSGDINATARILGISKSTLYRRIKQYGVSPIGETAL